MPMLKHKVNDAIVEVDDATAELISDMYEPYTPETKTQGRK